MAAMQVYNKRRKMNVNTSGFGTDESDMPASQKAIRVWAKVYSMSIAQDDIAQVDQMITPALAGTLMTPEEFDAADDWEEGFRYELIMIWAGLGRLPIVEREKPTIIVEFVSKGRRNRLRDYQTKRREYGEIKVKEYWIIDRFQRKMTAVRYGRSKASTLVVREGEVNTTDLLPGFELPISRLLAEADMLEQVGGDEEVA